MAGCLARCRGGARPAARRRPLGRVEAIHPARFSTQPARPRHVGGYSGSTVCRLAVLASTLAAHGIHPADEETSAPI